jgi:hypothetical protein
MRCGDEGWRGMADFVTRHKMSTEATGTESGTHDFGDQRQPGGV